MFRRALHSLRPSFSRLSLVTQGIRPSAYAAYSTQVSQGVTISRFDLLHASPNTKLVKGVLQNGFVVNGMEMKGPVFILNNQVFLFNCPQFGITTKSDLMDTSTDLKVADSYSQDASKDPSNVFYNWEKQLMTIIKVCDPAPEILVVGSGIRLYPFPQQIKHVLKDLGIQLEVQSSRSAASTFNVLQQENRRVAALLLPLVPTSAKTGEILVKLEQKITTAMRKAS